MDTSKATPSRPYNHPREFGYAVCGPILADMLWRLHAHLNRSSNEQVVFFCARGGLVLRRALELFMRRVGLDLCVRSENFMVSRLTAFRTAFQLDPAAVAPLVEMEFSDRTCADAIRAMTRIEVDADPKWSEPFKVARLIELMESTEIGRQVRAANDQQAMLLRRHIDELRQKSQSVILCDTGVFGSILRYLQVGVPAVNWRSALLFRSNYKRLSVPHFESTVGVVSEANGYVPWRPLTVALLYWPFIESMLEPTVPSVRYYTTEINGHVVSDLEVSGWENKLDPPPESVLAGAYSYLQELTPESIPSIEANGTMAWSKLRRMIVSPTTDDIALLAVGQRCLDFGVNESVEFTSRLDAGRSFREQISAVRASMWPEGELRKQFPRAAGPVLLSLELFRLIKALAAAQSFDKSR